MQPLARIPHSLGEDGLNVHVDVLVVHGELHLAGLDVGQNGLQPGDNGLGLVGLDDAGPAQHLGVGDGAGDVLLVQPGIEADGGIKVVDKGVGFLLEPSGPEFHSNRSLLKFPCSRRGYSFPCSRRA